MSEQSAASSSQFPASRSLLWVPIVHSPEDMGGLGASVRNNYLRRRGRSQWVAYLKRVDPFWKEIQRMIHELGLDWPRVRLFQDGLPVCDHATTIVRELAEKGSANHRLLVDLIERGAKLTGTETPQLLIQEYELNRRIAHDPPSVRGRARLELERQARQLLDERDAFIAARIAATLQPNEQGLIFLGMLHSLEGRLPRDIKVSTLRPGKSHFYSPDRLS